MKKYLARALPRDLEPISPYFRLLEPRQAVAGLHNLWPSLDQSDRQRNRPMPIPNCSEPNTHFC